MNCFFPLKQTYSSELTSRFEGIEGCFFDQALLRKKKLHLLFGALNLKTTKNCQNATFWFRRTKTQYWVWCWVVKI